MNKIKILHTADWHLGARLAGQTRDAEHRAFLDWLLELLASEQADILIIAGDIFDSATPPVAAQEMYYRFLHAASARCRHIIIIGGNHDSAAFLDAPRTLLAALSAHVLGATADPDHETLQLHGAHGSAIISLVPYLRERDLRFMHAGESMDDKARALRDAIAAHYARAAQHAEKLRGNADIPAIATGHLFAAGGITSHDDGTRDIHVGNLAQIGADAFPASFDYIALGHLHRAQTVGGRAHIRYSGAPLALGFGESGMARAIVRITFHGRTPEIDTIAIPQWQKLARLHGDRESLAQTLHELVAQNQSIWTEAHLDADTFDSSLHDTLQAIVADTPVKLLRLHNAARRAQALGSGDALPSLASLTPNQVFDARLARDNIDAQRARELRHAFAALLETVEESDAH